MRLDRRKALWEASALHDRPVALYEGQPSESNYESQVDLPLLHQSENIAQNYATTGLSVKGHPLSFLRDGLEQLYVITARDANVAATNLNYEEIMKKNKNGIFIFFIINY